jgi:hypothetical protein
MIFAATSSSVTSDRLPWLISRGAGLTALVIMMIVVLLGLMSAGRVWSMLGRPQWKAKAIAWHRPLAWTGLTAVLIHVGLLYFDPWLKPGVQGLMAPFTLHRLPTRWWVEMGALALWASVFTLLSFYARRSLRDMPGGWKGVHRLGWLAGTLILVHAMGSGTDLKHGWPRDAMIVLISVVALTFFMRLRLAKASPTASKSR